ncbi:hypothetical protein APTSU1_000443600 [Apodemus speciosus]|uniref:Uncharacterized protein n=1 Tax=Apodemus speciosus TaxID=105296 RepID=A0ABQ0EQ97_APOSI
MVLLAFCIKHNRKTQFLALLSEEWCHSLEHSGYVFWWNSL